MGVADQRSVKSAVIIGEKRGKERIQKKKLQKHKKEERKGETAVVVTPIGRTAGVWHDGAEKHTRALSLCASGRRWC